MGIRQDMLEIHTFPQAGVPGKCSYLKDSESIQFELTRRSSKVLELHRMQNGERIQVEDVPLLSLEYEESKLVACTWTRPGTEFVAGFNIIKDMKYAASIPGIIVGTQTFGETKNCG